MQGGDALQRSRLGRAVDVYLGWLVRRPLVVLLAALAVTVVLGAGASKLRVYVDQDANLPADHPWVEADGEIEKTFGGRHVAAIALRVREGDLWNPRHLGLLVDLTRDVEELPGVRRDNVFSIASPKAKDVRGTEEGLEVAEILPEAPASVAEAHAARDAYERNRGTLGPLVSRDGDSASVSMDFDSGLDDAEVYADVRALVDRYEKRYPEVELFLTGMPIFMHFFTLNAQRSFRWFLLALGMIFVTLWVAFRSFQGMLIPTLTGIASTVWSVGLMGWAGAHMDGWNSMTPILILAVAAGHSVQILKRYLEEYARRDDLLDRRERNRVAVREATRKIGLVMIVAGVVAAGGFLSLVVFRIPSIQAFGLFTAAGILSAVVLELTFVPALRTLLPPPRVADRRDTARTDEQLRQLGEALARPRVRHGLYAATALVLFASALLSTRIETNSSVRDYLMPDSEPRIGSEMMEEELGGIMPVFVLVEGEEPGVLQDPRVLAWMDGLGEALREVSTINFVVSLADVVRQLHRTLHADDPAFDVVPEDPALVAQYFFLYEMTASPEDFSRFVTTDYSRGLLRAIALSDRAGDVEPVIAVIDRWAAAHPLPAGVHHRIGGGGPVSLAVNATLTEGKMWNIGLILFMVYLLSSAVLGSPLAGLFVILPLVVAVALNFAALGAFGIWLNMATATVAAMAVGIGADYAIYVTYRIREEYARIGDAVAATSLALATSGKAVVFVATAISVGYLSLAASDFYVNQVLSRLVPLTMAASCLVALTLLPAVILHVRPRFLFPGEPEIAGAPVADRGASLRSVSAGEGTVP